MASEEIKTEKKKRNLLLKIFLCFLFLILISIFYAFKIEPKCLKVTETAIINEKLPESFDGLKIVQFSDIHFGVSTGEKELEKVINKINELKPDIITFTGDLFDSSINLTDDNIKYLEETLKKLDAKLIKLAIKGDSDYLNENAFVTIFQEANFKILESENIPLFYEDETPIYIGGISSITKNKYDLTTALKKDNPNYLQIFLVHEPILFDEVANNTDMVLSGHSMGGLIRLPFLSYSFDNTGSYQKGAYQNKNSTLYVSGGIGTTKINARFLNTPEINLYRLYHS